TTSRATAVDPAVVGRQDDRTAVHRRRLVRDRPPGPQEEPPQALADQALVHPARAERRLRLADGGHPEVYTRPYEPARPQVCLDEASTQLLKDARPPHTAKPGKPARHDYEYERNGTANLFMVTEPLRGWRHVEVTDRRTKLDWARVIRDLADVRYPD